jgi:predicted aspartyl protease
LNILALNGMINKPMAAAALFLLASVALGSAASGDGHSYPLSLPRGSRLMIQAAVNGHDVEAILDSAAEMTLIDREFAKKLNLKSSSSVEGQGSGKASFEAGIVEGVQLDALGLSLSNQTVAIVDLEDVGKRLLGRRVDVILGREIFDAARLLIDIDGHRIAVIPRDREPAGVRLQLITEHGVETVPVRVEGAEPVSATFDLGNGTGVLVSSGLAQRMQLLTDGRSVKSAGGGGLGGVTMRQTFKLKSVELAGQVFTNVTAAIDAQPSASDVNIGVNVLRHFMITTDFANHAVWLNPRP